MELKNLSAVELITHIKKSNGAVVLWGAGDLGELIKIALEKAGVKIDFFCDSNENKQNKNYLGIPVIAPNKLFSFENKNTNIFISCNYIDVLKKDLDKKNFENIFHCFDVNTLHRDIFIFQVRAIYLVKSGCVTLCPVYNFCLIRL